MYTHAWYPMVCWILNDGFKCHPSLWIMATSYLSPALLTMSLQKPHPSQFVPFVNMYCSSWANTPNEYRTLKPFMVCWWNYSFGCHEFNTTSLNNVTDARDMSVWSSMAWRQDTASMGTRQLSGSRHVPSIVVVQHSWLWLCVPKIHNTQLPRVILGIVTSRNNLQEVKIVTLLVPFTHTIHGIYYAKFDCEEEVQSPFMYAGEARH